MSQFNDPTLGNPPPPKKGSPVMMIVIILLVVLVVLPAICCGVFGYMGYSGFNAAMSEGAKQILQPVVNAPAMQEHIGEVTSATMNIMGTAKRAEQTGEQGIMLIDVSGSKGKGTVVLQGAAGNTFQSATLELPDGRSFPLDTDGGIMGLPADAGAPQPVMPPEVGN